MDTPSLIQLSPFPLSHTPVEMDNPYGDNPAGSGNDQCLAGTEPGNPNRVYVVRKYKVRLPFPCLLASFLPSIH